MIFVRDKTGECLSDIQKLKKNRVASFCVCCGNDSLLSSPAILMPFVAHRVFGWSPVNIDSSWGLRTISNGKAYTICSSLLCKQCGLLFLDMRFSEEEMTKLYSGYRNEDYCKLRENYEPGYFIYNDYCNKECSYLSKVEEFLSPYLQSPLSILDWGGFDGHNTPFKGKSKNIDIYDISEVKVIKGVSKVTKVQTYYNKYTLVICSNILEHVPYPSDILFDIKKAMSRNTILYIEVPFEELMRKKNGFKVTEKRHWHEHINFFSKKSLIDLLGYCGFKILNIAELNITYYQGKTATVFQVAVSL